MCVRVPHLVYKLLRYYPETVYKNGKIDLEMLKYRLIREDHWIKTLRTVYPYGLKRAHKIYEYGETSWSAVFLLCPDMGLNL